MMYVKAVSDRSRFFSGFPLFLLRFKLLNFCGGLSCGPDLLRDPDHTQPDDREKNENQNNG